MPFSVGKWPAEGLEITDDGATVKRNGEDALPEYTIKSWSLGCEATFNLI